MSKVFTFALAVLIAQTYFKGLSGKDTHYALAVTELKDLLEMETILISNMEKYAGALERKLKIITKAVNKMETENLLAIDDAEKYLSNPLNSFSLIRRLQADWKAWHDYFLKPVGEVFLNSMRNILKQKPTYGDLKDAVHGLHRIQLIYNLEAEDMAKGLLNGKQYHAANFTMLDAVFIGRELHNMGFPVDALSWFETALRMEFDEELTKKFFSLDTTTIYENYKTIAMKNNLPYLPLKAIKNGTLRKPIEKSLKPQDKRLTTFNLKLALEKNITTAFKDYASLCRGDYSRKLGKQLCYQSFKQKEVFSFEVLKLEVLQENPNIMLYHDLLPDSTILTLIGMTEKQLEPVHNSQQNLDEGVSAKICSLANKTDFQEIMTKIMHRVFKVADLLDRSYETPTIVNYGIGGHETLHVDFIDNARNATHNDDNPKASLIFYLSDVEDGGATIFPAYNISVKPRKGAALFWSNFHPNGSVNYNTVPISCPVVVGSKWILNVWIRQ